jgi:hypothetical protein
MNHYISFRDSPAAGAAYIIQFKFFKIFPGEHDKLWLNNHFFLHPVQHNDWCGNTTMDNRQILLPDDDVKDHLHTAVFIPSINRFYNRQAAPEFIKRNSANQNVKL